MIEMTELEFVGILFLIAVVYFWFGWTIVMVALISMIIAIEINSTLLFIVELIICIIGAMIMHRG